MLVAADDAQERSDLFQVPRLLSESRVRDKLPRYCSFRGRSRQMPYLSSLHVASSPSRKGGRRVYYSAYSPDSTEQMS